MIDHITELRAHEADLPAAESHPDPPLASFPMRIEWEATLPVVPESHEWPAPEVVSQPTDDYLGKGAVGSLVKYAKARGWSVLVTQARGSYPGVAQRPSRPRLSFAVRMMRGAERAVAVYVEGPSEGSAWSWDVMFRWSSAGLVQHQKVEPFRASLA